MPRLGVLRGIAAYLGNSFFNIAMDADEIAIGKRVRKRNLRLDELVATKQIQLIRNWREICKLIAAGVNVRPKARQRLFFGDGHTANGVILLKDQDLKAHSGQVAGTGQAIVPRADDDRVVMMRHSQPSRRIFSVAPNAQNAKVRALTKAEILALLYGFGGFPKER